MYKSLFPASLIALALAIAILIVWLSPLQAATSEILARTEPTFFDLLVAVVEPPIALRLTKAAAARRVVGERFDRILTVIFDAIAERPGGAITLTLES